MFKLLILTVRFKSACSFPEQFGEAGERRRIWTWVEEGRGQIRKCLQYITGNKEARGKITCLFIEAREKTGVLKMGDDKCELF